MTFAVTTGCFVVIICVIAIVGYSLRRYSIIQASKQKSLLSIYDTITLWWYYEASLVYRYSHNFGMIRATVTDNMQQTKKKTTTCTTAVIIDQTSYAYKHRVIFFVNKIITGKTIELSLMKTGVSFYFKKKCTTRFSCDLVVGGLLKVLPFSGFTTDSFFVSYTLRTR